MAKDEIALYSCLQIMSLPMDMLSAENLSSDVFHGCFVMTCTLFAFIGLVWLREQILHAGGPDWLDRDNVQLPPVDHPPLNLVVPVQQFQEQRALQQQEIQDNNNVPPFVDEPPVLPEHSNNDDLENAEERRIEENNIPDNERMDENDGIDRDVELHVALRNAEQQIEQPIRDIEPPMVVPRNVEPLIPPRDVEQPAAARDELGVDGEQANARAGEGWRDQAQGQAQGEAEEANWNPLEWDRPEELTWERLLGLDGSLVFLEHVFWVVSLNTLFIVVCFKLYAFDRI